MDKKQESPSRLWYVGHMFFGILSGILCFLKWRKTNRRMAIRHLLHSLWIPFVMFLPAIFIGMLLSP